jgi:DedD protein
MADEGFREVQLTGKKLVFLAMVGAVVLVVVFLLGVMVGRGVRGPGAADAVPLQADVPPGPVPPPTKPAAGDLDYAALVGGGDAKKAIEPPSAPPDAAAPSPAGADAAKAIAKPAAQPPGPPGQNEQPKSTPAARPEPGAKADVAARPAAPATGQWVVQVNAYSKKTTADSIAASLKKKSFDAFVVQNGPLYHVQIGPFTDRAEADKIRLLLQKEGYKPLVKR